MLGLGVWQYTPAVAKQASEAAFSVGFRSIDTAHDYNNQNGVGEFVKEQLAKGVKRTDLFITSKVPGCGSQGVGSGAKCGPDTSKLFTEDLTLLGLDSVDLMLVHFPPGGCGSLKCGEIQDQWKVFEDMYAAKKARAIGVSNYCQSCFECLFKTMTTKPMVNQVQYHVGMGTDAGGLVSYLKKENITMQAYSPLGDGSTELINGALVTKIAKAHGKASGATVALKWLVQSGIPVVTKASDPTYLSEDIDLFDWELTDAEMQELNSATSPAGKPSFVCTSASL
jgi:diketogulonate reductase-like aldo/keto reductase